MTDHWSIEAVAERIATPKILGQTTLDKGEAAYNAALAVFQKMPIENLLPILDTSATIETFLEECQNFCHLRAVAVVNEIRKHLHLGLNARN